MDLVIYVTRDPSIVCRRAPTSPIHENEVSDHKHNHDHDTALETKIRQVRDCYIYRKNSSKSSALDFYTTMYGRKTLSLDFHALANKRKTGNTSQWTFKQQ